MSEESRKYRAAMKAKAQRLGGSGDPHQKVDASSWTPPEPMNTTAQTGPRPVSRQRYKRGGMVEGAATRKHAGRRPRKAGGKALMDDFINRDVKEANEERPGIKHDGGMKKGGRAKRNMGGGLGMMGGLIPLAIEALSNRTDGNAPYAPGVPGQAPGKKSGGRAKRDMGGPLAGALSQGMGGQGRFNFNYPGAKSPAQALGLKTGGAAKHPKDCRCKECMGGRVERAGGGEVSHPLSNLGQFAHPAGGRAARKSGGKLDAEERSEMPKREFGLPGSRKYPMPDKSHAANAKARATQQEHKGHISKSTEEKIDAKADRVLSREAGGRAIDEASWGRGDHRSARKSGGRTSGKGKMSVNIVIAPGNPPQPAMGAPPLPGPAGPMPMPPKPPMPVMPVGGPPGMAGPPPMMPPPGGMPPPGLMGRKRGGLVDGGAGGGLGRLEKIRDYGDNAWDAEERR